jgi:MerR HTH family regulatory protein
MATQFERLSPDPPNGAAARSAHLPAIPAPRRADQALPRPRRYVPGAVCRRAEAARRAGVAPSTLRGWELRLLAGPSGGVGYTPYDIVRLEALARLVRAGLPAARAARRLDELAEAGGRVSL